MSQEENVRLMNVVAAMTTMIVALKIQIELHEQSVGRASTSTHLVRDNKKTKEQGNTRTREHENKRRREEENKRR